MRRKNIKLIIPKKYRDNNSEKNTERYNPEKIQRDIIRKKTQRDNITEKNYREKLQRKTEMPPGRGISVFCMICMIIFYYDCVFLLTPSA